MYNMRWIRKVLGILAVSFSISAVSCFPCRAEASSPIPDLPKVMGEVLFRDERSLMWEPKTLGDWWFPDGRISDLKLSAPSCLKVIYSLDKDNITLQALRPCRAEMSFKVTERRKTKSYSLKINVLGYSNPLKSITLRGVDLVSKYDHDNSYRFVPWLQKGKLAHPSGRFRVNPKKGWSVEKIRYVNDQSDGEGPTTKYVKNGEWIKFPTWETVHLTVFLRNKKLGINSHCIYLTVDRSEGADG